MHKFAVVALTLAACTTEAPAPTDAEASEEDPLAIGQQVPWPTDTWTVVTPEEMGMDPVVLEAAFEYAFAPGKNTQAVIVVRGGAIVAERYAEGKDASSVAASWSAGKSFASTLVGIALDDGLIDSVQTPMSTFVPQWAGNKKAPITLEHVLQMESGLDFVEDYADILESDVIAMGLRDDALAYAQALPVGSAPGSTWYYSSGDTMLLSGVIEAATGMDAHAFAKARIFDPIGMKSAYWWLDGGGHALTFCCVDAPSREFAKFGLLFLRGGTWDGTPIVSEAWVSAATTTRASTYAGYAYQWWTVDIDEASPLPRDTYSARGLDGQYFYVIPSHDLVVVRNSLYAQPPGDKVAAGGFLRHIMPGGLAEHGTQAPDSWNDARLLGPIINSIDGADAIEIPPDDGDAAEWGDEPAPLCQAEAETYPAYCEGVHGCACDTCPVEFLTCDKDPGCKAIMSCALENGCRGVACATACQGEIEDNGGVFGEPAMTALALSDCVAPCPVECE